MFWDALKNILFISVGKITNQASTKQTLVSDIAQTFDVLSWLSPSTILMKILFQQLWELKLDWDDEVPQALHDKHQFWREQLLLFTFPPSVAIINLKNMFSTLKCTASLMLQRMPMLLWCSSGQCTLPAHQPCLW